MVNFKFLAMKQIIQYWSIVLVTLIIWMPGCDLFKETPDDCDEKKIDPPVEVYFAPKLKIEGSYYIDNEKKYRLADSNTILVKGEISLMNCDYTPFLPSYKVEGKIFPKELNITAGFSHNVPFDEEIKWYILNKWMYYVYNYQVEVRFPDVTFTTEVLSMNTQRYEVWEKYDFEIVFTVNTSNVWTEYR
jgi:hypothetical protein